MHTERDELIAEVDYLWERIYDMEDKYDTQIKNLLDHIAQLHKRTMRLEPIGPLPVRSSDEQIPAHDSKIDWADLKKTIEEMEKQVRQR